VTPGCLVFVYDAWLGSANNNNNVWNVNEGNFNNNNYNNDNNNGVRPIFHKT
jgi:hypothetical protein